MRTHLHKRGTYYAGVPSFTLGKLLHACLAALVTRRDPPVPARSIFPFRPLTSIWTTRHAVPVTSTVFRCRHISIKHDPLSSSTQLRHLYRSRCKVLWLFNGRDIYYLRIAYIRPYYKWMCTSIGRVLLWACLTVSNSFQQRADIVQASEHKSNQEKPGMLKLNVVVSDENKENDRVAKYYIS